jgi:hypothetical protein
MNHYDQDLADLQQTEIDLSRARLEHACQSRRAEHEVDRLRRGVLLLLGGGVVLFAAWLLSQFVP